MSKRISESKAIDVSRAMTKGILNKSDSLIKELRDLIEQCFLNHSPKEVLDFYSKFPDNTRTAASFYFKSRESDMKSIYIHTISAPAPCKDQSGYVNIIYQYPEISKKAEHICDLIIASEKEYEAMRGKIKCALLALKTYAKIKSDFPEAYAILEGDIEEEDKSPNLCDSVESIRAELNSKK